MVLCLAGLTTVSVQAAELPGGSRKITLTAREQPIAAFLQDFFGQLDLPVVVSPAVKGSVNGTFVADANSTLRSLSRAFGLATYFDGMVMYVYAAAELTTRTMPTTSAAVSRRVLSAAEEMGLIDARNSVRVSGDGSLMVSGTKRFVEQVGELARASQMKQMIQPTLGFKVFYLRYAWAQDVTVNFGSRRMVVPGVATTLRSLVTASPRSPASMVAQERQLRPTQPKLRGQGLGRNQPVLGASDDGGQSGTADVLLAAYGDDGAGGGAAAVALGSLPQVRIEADTRLNAVIVRDAPERLPLYEQLVQALDIEPQSLEIEATIIDVNTDKATELGINWRANTGRSSSLLFGRGDSSDLLLQPGGGVVGSAITPTGRGGFVSAVLGDASQFVARISALQTEGAARVVSSPQVVTLSNVEAIFDNSSTFYVKVAGREEVDLFNVSAGTSLRVTPHVFKDTDGVRIKLLVNLEDGTVNRSRAVEGIPSVDRSSINTQALIYEGESLLIGGLTREATESGSDKIPLLGDIPLLGNLFKTQRKSGARIERMFLISPRLSAKRAASTGPAPAALMAAPPDQPVGPVPPAPALAPPSTPPVLPAPPPASAAPSGAALPAAEPDRTDRQSVSQRQTSDMGRTLECSGDACVRPQAAEREKPKTQWQSTSRPRGG